MTGPDELRLLRNGDNEHDAELDAAADAWEKLQNDYNGLTDIADGLYHTVIEVVAENEKLEKRLEAAEKVRQTIVAWREKPYTMTAETLLDLIDAALAGGKP
jgi:hypothetical protein